MSLSLPCSPNSQSTSSDLWVTTTNCKQSATNRNSNTGSNTGICTTGDSFNTGSSSTFKSLNEKFGVTYGSGQVAGTLGSDTVSMGGFSVQSQVFGLVDRMTVDLTTGTVSGILGLAFQSLANSRAMPWWQALQTGGQWDEPVMSFYLTRSVLPPARVLLILSDRVPHSIGPMMPRRTFQVVK